jgi:hypothetical protein
MTPERFAKGLTCFFGVWARAAIAEILSELHERLPTSTGP